jgi:hypothetical protein
MANSVLKEIKKKYQEEMKKECDSAFEEFIKAEKEYDNAEREYVRQAVFLKILKKDREIKHSKYNLLLEETNFQEYIEAEKEKED